MLQHRSSKDVEASRPSPAYFSPEQVADYLNDLRKNRPARPAGARPLPGRNGASAPSQVRGMPPRAESALAMRPHLADSEAPERSASAMSHRRTQSSLSNRQDVGRPLARPPPTGPKSRQVSQSTMATSATNATNATTETTSTQGEQRQYTIPYYERGQRWMEKQEAGSLRQALEQKDRMEEEAQIHNKAQDEAAELVWNHQNPQDAGAPYRNPDVDYKQHLRKGSHARSQSIGPFSSLYVKKGGSDGSRSASEGSSSSGGRVVSSGSAASAQSSQDETTADRAGRLPQRNSFGSIKNKYGSLKSSLSGPREMIRRRSSSAKGRKTSGESGKSVFRNPEDQIYEEPEDITTTENIVVTKTSRALANKPRNTSYGSRIMNEKSGQRSQTDPAYNKIDIHKNAPTQSRNAAYQRNDFPTRTASPDADRPPTREGKEIRGDDIRSATSMRLKDRSEKLPMPTIVSNRPGRPIVSFRSPEVELTQETSSRPSTREGPNSRPSLAQKPPMSVGYSEPIIPTINVASAPSIQVNEAPVIPTINVPDETGNTSNNCDVPSISVSDAPSINITPDVPTVVTSPATRPNQTSARPLPRPGAAARPPPANRPLPHHSSTAPVKSMPHWSPAAQLRRNQAQCAACALPISGRIVGAAGQRFHPECFTCFQCGELLECVAFYPEPDKQRFERLARIEARVQGQPIPEDQAHHTEVTDGDESLRFFCHLDFHESFSPRCRSCKTPIEGEVIVACGGEWHAGHFFCAECGDPFDEKTPFVERDGYAWCTGCHTKKHYGKCAGCKKPILDVVMKAMGLEWHEGCFVCCQCGGGFGDGRFFVREGEGLPVCVGCEERRLKA